MKPSKRTAILIALLISVLSVVFLYLLARHAPEGPLRETGTNVLNTLLALGLIGLVYEVALRDAVFRETVESIGLQADVAASSLSSIGRATAIDYPELLEQADSISVVVVNPVGWMERDWNYLLSAARERPLNISVFIPAPGTEVANETAQRLGYEPSLYSEQARLMRDYIEVGWKSARGTVSPPVKGCTLKLAMYDFVPAYEMAATQSKVCLLIPEVGPQSPGGDKLRLSFTRRRGPFPADWLIQHMRALSSLPADYADEVS